MTSLDALLDTAIGNTPLVELRRVVPEGCGRVLLKLESGNPTGSYKDRLAASIVGGALARGDITAGDRVVEYTGGSTGSALAFVCARLGLGFVAVSSDAFAASKLHAMRAYGAEVVVEPSTDGTITPDLIARMRERAYSIASEPASFYADQFGSADIRPGYVPMGREIADQCDGRIDVLCAGVGTGGALMGAMDGLHESGETPAVYPCEPAQSPLLTTGTGGPHRVEGVGVGFEPPFLDLDRCAGVRTVDEHAAMAMARRLAVEEGLLVGTSSGLNVCAAIELAAEHGPGSTVVTLGVDHGMKYFGGPLYP